MERWKGILTLILVAIVAMAMGCASMDTMAKKSTLTEKSSALASEKAVEITPATVTDTKPATKTPLLPKAKNYMAISDAEIQIKTTLEKTELLVPITRGQMEKDPAKKDAEWQICTSWAWTDGQEWYLVGQADYGLPTQKDGSNLKATMKFPDKGIGWYWIRIWGQDIKSKDWLWINQSSSHCRNDTQGNPGYEALVHPASGQYRAVSAEYQIRK